MERSSDLAEFMQDVTRKIEFDYNWIQKRTLEDPGTAGDQGEENWATILRDWLPSYYHIVTKGRILGVNGETSPQIDVVVLKPSYPKALLNYKLYLASGVAAAFECKNTFKKQHIVKVMRNAIAIKNMHKFPRGSYTTEMYRPIIYGLLAHSHEGVKNKPKAIVNITKAIEAAGQLHIKSIPDQPDFFCVSDLACWSVWKQPLKQDIYKKDGLPAIRYLDFPVTGYGLSAKGIFEGNERHEKHFTPLGVFIAKLMWRLSKVDSNVLDLSEYFSQALFHPIKVETVRQWPGNTLSTMAKKELENLDRSTLQQFLQFDHWYRPVK